MFWFILVTASSEISLLVLFFISRHYPALKTAQQLEHTLLPRVAKLRFARHISGQIPALRSQIEDKLRSELNDFLDTVRKLVIHYLIQFI